MCYVCHDPGGGFQTHVTGPGEAALGEGYGYFRWCAVDNSDAAGRAGVSPDGVRMGDGGGQADAASIRGEGAEARDAEGELFAALGAGEGVYLVHHDAREGLEKSWRVGERDEDTEAFWCGEKDVGWGSFLTGAAVGRGIAGSSLDGDVQTHVLDGAGQVAGDVGGEGFQWADVERVEVGTGIRGEIDEAGEEAGQGLAAAGRGDQQDAFARSGGVQHCHLARPGVQPWAANHVANGSGNVPDIGGDKHARRSAAMPTLATVSCWWVRGPVRNSVCGA